MSVNYKLFKKINASLVLNNMNFKNLIFAAILVFGFSACRDTAKEDHGHEAGQ
jgi:anaerobic C4-dicarboxylate transporter